MEFEPWMLLAFPLFFGMGWLAARMDIKQLVDESSALPRSYFQGLQFLLNEQQDKAIDAFIEVVKVDPQTVDLHFALGSLFRRRGEVDRALRMHLNLAERADLDESKKEQARFELAQDYLKAGILDRAESIFLDLQNTPYGRQALEFLLETYQKEHDWLKAVDITQRLSVLTNQSHAKEAAFFYCELAEEDLARQRPDAARAHLEQALDTWPHLTRATIMLGDMEKAAGNPARAIEAWRQIEQHDPQYLPLVAERLLDAYREGGQLDQAARPGPAAGDAPAERGRRAAQRCRTGAQAAAPAHQCAVHVPLLQLRLQGAAVLLALPGLLRMGNLCAAAYRRKRQATLNPRARLEQQKRPQNHHRTRLPGSGARAGADAAA
jgi:lipopolysaccharide biosynthesis regulator YciM